MELRPARPDEAQTVATIWRDGWADAHIGNVPDELVAIRTPESFDSRAVNMIDDTVVAVVDGEVAGFVTVVQDEVEQVYVAKQHRGAGVAGALLTESERLVAANGHEVAWLAVSPGNTRARRFYERSGWSDEGVFEYGAATLDGTIPVPCNRYVKAVGEAM